MNGLGAIPSNIGNALIEVAGYVVVITGKPGVGKTLLAQEVVRSVADSFLVLTSSENMTTYTTTLSRDIKDWKQRHVDVQYIRRTDDIDLQEKSLGEIMSILTGEDLDLGPFSTIVIDSWTDFLEPYDEIYKRSIEHFIVEASRREGKKMVLVTDFADESEINGSIYYTADAIVRLEKVRSERRTYRRLIVEKMRGIPLEQDEFMFTLHNGRFTFIPWYKHKYPAITIERDPLADPSRDRISTGSKSLDNVIGGGFQKGALNLVEVDTLAAPYLETVYIPFLSNQLQLGRPIIIILPEGWSPERFTHGLTHFVEKEVVEEQVVFFGRQALGRASNVRHIDDDPWKTLQEMRYESNQLARKFGDSTIEFFALDTLENKYGPAIAKGIIAEITAALPGTNTTTILILSRHQSIKSSSLPHSIHVAIQEMCGVIGVFGVNPRTGILALTPRLAGGFLDYDLIPVV